MVELASCNDAHVEDTLFTLSLPHPITHTGRSHAWQMNDKVPTAMSAVKMLRKLSNRFGDMPVGARTFKVDACSSGTGSSFMNTASNCNSSMQPPVAVSLHHVVIILLPSPSSSAPTLCFPCAQANHPIVRRLVQLIGHNYDDFAPRLPLADFTWLLRSMGILGGREWYQEEMHILLEVWCGGVGDCHGQHKPVVYESWVAVCM